MWRCPVCEKEHLQGLVCDDCGFDSSCNYERNRTLYSALPKHIEPVSARAAKWRQRQQQTVAVSPGNLVCPKCGGKQFFFLIDELQFMCTDCKAKMPAAVQMDGPVSESDPSVEDEAPTASSDPPVAVPAKGPTQTMAGPLAGLEQPGEPEPELEPEPEPAPGPKPEPEPVQEPEFMPTHKRDSKLWENPYVLFFAMLCVPVTMLMIVIVAGVQQLALPNTANPYGEAGQTITNGGASARLNWALDYEGVLTIWGSGEMYDVDSESQSWNDCKDKITSVVVEPGITNISYGAFEGCSRLTSITLPESMTVIGDWAFSGCTSLTSVTLPEGVTVIGEAAFYGCTSLTDVYYGGAEEQWRSIEIGRNNDDLLNAAVHYNS